MIEQEFLRHIGQPQLQSLLAQLELIDETELSIHGVSDWIPGGETYHRIYEVRTPSEQRLLVVKDCIGFGGEPAKVLDEWLARRRIVESAGIHVPKLYGRARATIIEEYIPDALPSVRGHVEGDGVRRATILVIERLLAAGFRPTAIHDWRWKGEEPVIIDFGSDLGGPDHGPAASHIAHRIVKQLVDSLE